MFSLLVAMCTGGFTVAHSQPVSKKDSLTLVAFYHQSNGHGWYNHTNWLTHNPVSTWYGVSVSDNRVSALSLGSNNLTGSIFKWIGNLDQLYNLLLDNNQLKGSIPVSIGKLTGLTILNLSHNQLSGQIPASIGNLHNLTFLFDLSNNQLSGPIPNTIGDMSTVRTFDMSHNRLSGNIPSALGAHDNINLSYNELCGSIPSSMGDNIYVRNIYLNNNQLSGEIPASFTNFVRISDLFLNNNHLTQYTNDHPVPLPYYGNNNISNNNYTFNGIELTNVFNLTYSPQARIPIHQHGNSLAVSAGGTLSNNTYTWFRVETPGSHTLVGDSSFQPTENGRYFAQVTNAIATELTLYTDTITYTAPCGEQEKIAMAVSAVWQQGNKQFSVFPNPARDILHIRLNGTARMVFISETGKTLLSATFTGNNDLNVSRFASGTYYLHNTSTGEKQKVLIVH